MKRNITIVVVSVIAALMVIGAVPVVGASDPSPQIIEVSYPSLVYDGQKATIAVTAKNNGGFSDDGYISVSFPNDEDILESDVYGTGNDYNNLYPKGYWSLYNSTDQQMTSVDPLVELHDTNWGEGREERITMSVSPTGAEQIVFYVRVALKNSEGTFIRAPDSSGYIDQQGWCVNRYTIDVVYPPPLLWKYKTDGDVGSVSISSDGNYVAAGSDDCVYLFDMAGTRLWKRPTGDYVYSVDISNDGNYVAAGCSWEDSSYDVCLFNKTGTQLWKRPTDGYISSVSISSDGNYVAASSYDKYVYLFDRTGTRLWKKPTDSYVYSVDISSDGNYVAAGSDDRYVYLFDRAGTRLWKRPTDGYVYSVDISSDGSYVAAGSSDNYVYLFDKTGTRLWKNPAHSSVGSVSISSDGDYVASGTSSYGYNNNFSYFDKGGNKLWNYSIGTYKSAYVSVSDDGSYIAAGSHHLESFTVYFFNKGGILLWKEGYSVNSDAVRISSDGNYVVVGSGNYICLFDAFAELQIPLDFVPEYITTGDLDNNGRNDIVTSDTNQSNPVMNLYGQQSDHIFVENEFFDDGEIASVSIGDMDDNGFDDIAGLYGYIPTEYAYSGVRVWYQNGGGFGSYVDITFDDLYPNSLSVDDLNGDGLDDIAIIGNGNISIFYQQVDHTFNTIPDYTLIWDYSSWPFSIVTGDINGDELNDIAAGHCGPSFSGVGISFFHQTEGHSFVAAPFGFGDINTMLSASIGDLNNDGLNDVAIARFGFSVPDILIYHQKEDNTFNFGEHPQDADKIILTDSPVSISVCDLNDDGLDDIAVGNRDSKMISVYYQKIEDIAPTFSINTDKSVYHTGETSEIEIAITNNMASSVTLLVSSEIYLPDKTTHSFLQKTITISPKDRKSVFYYYDIPDSTGYYTAKVSIQDENSGTVYGSAETSFYVQKESPIPESELEIDVYKDRSTYFYGNVFYIPNHWVALGNDWKDVEGGYKILPYNESIRIAVKITDETGNLVKNVDIECKLVNVDNPNDIISSGIYSQILDSQGLAIFIFEPRSEGNYYIDVTTTKNNALKAKNGYGIINVKNADFYVNFKGESNGWDLRDVIFYRHAPNEKTSKNVLMAMAGRSPVYDITLNQTSIDSLSNVKLVFDGLLYYTYKESPVLNYGLMPEDEEKTRSLELRTLTGFRYFTTGRIVRPIRYTGEFEHFDYLTEPYITILFKYNNKWHSTQHLKLNDFGLYPNDPNGLCDDSNTVGFTAMNYGIKTLAHIVPGAYFPLAFTYDLYDFEEGITNPNMVNLPSTMGAGVGISAFGAKMLGIKSAAIALHALSAPFIMGAPFFGICGLLMQAINQKDEVGEWEQKFVAAAANKIWEDRPSNDLLIYYTEKSGILLRSRSLNAEFVNIAPYDINATLIYEPQGKTTFGDSFKRLNTIQKNFILKPGESKKENFAHSNFNHRIFGYVLRAKYKPVVDNKNLFEHVTTINGDGIAISNAQIWAKRNDQIVCTDTFLKNDKLFLELDLTEKRNSEYEDIFYRIAIYRDGSYIPRTAKKKTIRISGTEGNDLSYQRSLNKFNEGRYEIRAILYTKENGDIIDELSIPFNVHNSQLGSISSSHQHTNSILIESVLVDAVNQTPITEASVFANITNPNGLVETIELSENTAGDYSVIYENDTLPGIYYCKLFVDKSPYISMVDDFIFTKSPSDLNLIIQRTELTEGEAGDIQIIIDNPSEYQINDVSLSISSSSVLDMTVNQNKQIVGDIPAQQTKTVNITVTPQDIGKFDVLVYASSDDELIGIGTGEIKVLPPKEYGVELTAESYFKTVWSDSPQQINFTLYVQNTGDLEENVELHVSTPPNITCNYPNYLTLMPNEIEEITIELNSDVLNNESIISIPVSTKIKETDEVQSITLNVNFNKLRPILEIEPHSVYTTINQVCGEKINLTLLETGGKVSPTNITWEVNWSNAIDPEIIISIPSGFSIPANASKNLTMDILTANDIAPYNYVGYVIFQCDQGNIALVKIEIIVESTSNQPSVTVLHPNGGESIPIGTEVQVSAHATDDTAVTSVTFSYSSNGGSDWNSIGAGIRFSGTDKDGIWNGTWNTNSLGAGSNYLIKAVASDGTSTDEDQSDSTFSLTCTPPSAPTLNDPGTADADGNYTVAWSSVSGATNYTLEEDTSGSFGSPTVVYSGSGTSAQITDRGDGTYYYRVNACNACGCSGWSNVEDIHVEHISKPQTSVKEMWRYKTNSNAKDVEIADIDNDGDSEVIVASDQLYILKASGGKEISFGQNVVSVEISDLDGNGIDDVIAAENGGVISAYTGNGLELWRLTLTTDFPKVITAFDIDGDGLDEILLASRECKFYLISGDDGCILWSYSIGAWSDTSSMDGAIIDDINDDTVFDIIVGGRDSKITALSGASGSVLWEFTLLGWVGCAINAGDLNDDAYDDVVVGSWDTDVYAINGYNGSLLWKFVTPTSGISPASVAIIGDINTDETQDVAAGLGEVYALDGKTGHQIWKSADSFLGIEDLVTTDLNTDGILDVCIGTNGCDPYANVYAIDGDNGNTLWSFLEPKYTVYGLTAGDIDGDGKSDVIVGSKDTYVYALTTLITNATNCPPVASVTYSPLTPVVGQTIAFDLSSSYDSDGEITHYRLDFGDESWAEGPGLIGTIGHEYSSAWSYTVTLTVTDNDDATGTETKTLIVTMSLKGDLNHDGILTPADAAIALRLAASGGWDPAADVDSDRRITSLDALMILQAATDAIELRS